MQPRYFLRTLAALQALGDKDARQVNPDEYARWASLWGVSERNTRRYVETAVQVRQALSEAGITLTVEGPPDGSAESRRPSDRSLRHAGQDPARGEQPDHGGPVQPD